MQTTAVITAQASAAASPDLDRSVFVPERVRVERYVAAVLFLLSISYLLIFRRYTTIEPDEGIVLEGAQRILRGQIPYRDFFSFLTPGSLYFASAIFEVFGNSFLVARTTLAVVGGVMALVTYLLSRRVCSRQTSLLVAGLVTLTALPYRFLVLHNWDSTLMACLAVYCAARVLESPHWSWAFALGSFASLTFLFEQSKGAGLLAGLGIAFALIAWGCARDQVFIRANWLGFIAGLTWPMVITFAYFASQHAVAYMLADWAWPLHHYSHANRVPYGFQNWSENDRNMIFHTGSLGIRLVKMLVISPCFLVPVLPLIALSLLVHWSRLMLRLRIAGVRYGYYVLVTAVIAGLLLSIVVARADIIHFMYLLPIFALVIAWIIEGNDIPGQLFKAVRPMLTALIVIAFVAFSLPLLLRALGSRNEIVTRKGMIRTPAKDNVIDYVQAHVHPGEPMLVYPYLPLYNYLTNTSSPGPFEYFQPGMSTAEQAQELIATLSTTPVTTVLFESSFPEKIPNSWPGTPMLAIAADPVADYIFSRYHTCKVLNSPSNWRFFFMVLKEVKCPTSQ